MPTYPWNQPLGVNYKHITGAGTTVLSPHGGGILQGAVLNAAAGTTALGMSFYDTPATGGVSASTLIAGTVPVTTDIIPFGLQYGVSYNTGLTVVTAAAALSARRTPWLALSEIALTTHGNPTASAAAKPENPLAANGSPKTNSAITSSAADRLPASPSVVPV